MKNIYIILLIIIILPSCKKEEEKKEIFAPRLNISDAKAIFTIDKNGDNGENFYKITNDNKIEKITYIHTDGVTIFENPISDSRVKISDLLIEETFILFQDYNGNSWNEAGESEYKERINVVIKETGEIIEILDESSNIRTSLNPFKNDTEIQSNSNNFYLLLSSKICKFNESFIAETHAASEDIELFFVNDDDFIIQKYFNVDYNNNKYSLRTPSSFVFSVINNTDGDIVTSWLGTDNNFYILRQKSLRDNYIDKIVTNGEDFTITNVLSNNNEFVFRIHNNNYFKRHYRI